jgi:hypothetical protein
MRSLGLLMRSETRNSKSEGRPKAEGESEILQGRLSSSGRRHHMVHMKRGFLARLGETAIFATVFRPLHNLAPQARANVHGIRNSRGSLAANASARGKGFQPARPALPLHLFQRVSTVVRGPVCQAGHAAAFQRLSVVETLPNLPASALRVELLGAYHTFVAESGCSADSSRSNRTSKDPFQ